MIAEKYGDFHLRTWKDNSGYGFRLELYDTNKTVHGKYRLAYQLFDGDELVFEGDDFGCSPCHCVDANETVAALLSFLSLRPGDTDREYFDDYTPRQMEWCRERGEELSACHLDLEEHGDPAWDADD